MEAPVALTLVMLALSGTVAFFVLAIPFLIAGSIRTSIETMQNPRFPRLEEDHPDYRKVQEGIGETGRWVAWNGYDWLGAYRFEQFLVAAWQNPAEATLLCKYLQGENHFHDFVTLWEERGGLTTGSSRDGLTLPTPDGWYSQAFENCTLREQHKRHLEGVAHLAHLSGEKPVLPPRDFAELVREKIRAQAEYVASKPLYPIRGIYWYLVRRPALVGKSITRRAA